MMSLTRLLGILALVVGVAAATHHLCWPDATLTSLAADWEVRRWVFRKDSFLVGGLVVVLSFSVSAYRRQVWPDVVELVSLVGWLGVMWGALQLLALVYLFDNDPAPDPVTAFAAVTALLWMASKAVLRAFEPLFTPSTTDPPKEETPPD